MEEAGGDGGAIAAGAVEEERAVLGERFEILGQMIERCREAAGDVFVAAFAWGADIDNERRMGGCEEFGGEWRAETFGFDHEIGTGFESVQAVVEISGDVIETDPPEANGGLVFPAGGCDDDDGVFAIEEGADPGCVLAAEADVDAAEEMGGCEFCGVAGIEDLGALCLEFEECVEGKGVHFTGERLVEGGALLAVEDGIVVEVVGGVGLVGGDDVDELFLGHGLEGVVGSALFAEGGAGFFAERFAAKRAGAVGGVDKTFIGEGEEFGVEGVEEQGSELSSGPAECGAEIGASDIADEEGVAGEDGVRFGGIGGEVEDEDGDGLRGVAGGFEDLEANVAEVETIAVVEWGEGVLGFGGSAEADGGADAVAKFEMAGDEIGVKVGEEDVFDGEAVLGGEGEVLVGVALGVDNGGGAGGFVTDDVRGVGEAGEIELVEDNGAPPGVGVRVNGLVGEGGEEFDEGDADGADGEGGGESDGEGLQA